MLSYTALRTRADLAIVHHQPLPVFPYPPISNLISTSQSSMAQQSPSDSPECYSLSRFSTFSQPCIVPICRRSLPIYFFTLSSCAICSGNQWSKSIDFAWICVVCYTSFHRSLLGIFFPSPSLILHPKRTHIPLQWLHIHSRLFNFAKIIDWVVMFFQYLFRPPPISDPISISQSSHDSVVPLPFSTVFFRLSSRFSTLSQICISTLSFRNKNTAIFVVTNSFSESAFDCVIIHFQHLSLFPHPHHEPC